MNSNQSLWKPGWLLAGQISAVVLLVSWFYPASHQYWVQLDSWFFWKMNGSMIDHPSWQYIMAWANYRAADLVPALLVLFLYLHFCIKGKYFYSITQRVTQGVTIFVLLLSTIIVYKFGLFEGLLRHFALSDLLPRRSATYVFENTVRLDELFPDINSKVTSKDSFPGDHAMVLLFSTVFISYYAGTIYGAISFLIAVIFIMPRLIGGAHWLSDVLVGGGAIVLASSSLYLATPIHKIVSDYLLKYITAVLRYAKNLYPKDKTGDHDKRNITEVKIP